MSLAPPSRIRRILLVRTDRIGDVVLSLPMLPALRRRFPDASVTVLVRPYTADLVRNRPDIDDVMLWEGEGMARVVGYVRRLRERSYDLCILPYPRFELALIAFLAGIPVRVGTGYRWYSFLFNERVYEHRKDARRHEAEYNLNLLRAVGADVPVPLQVTLTVPGDVQRAMDARLAELGVGDFIVLHPGSGGSARDWPVEHFAELAVRAKGRLGCSVVLTGSEHERSLTSAIAGAASPGVVDLAGRLSLLELAALYSRARAFAANSTGPLHIAAAVGAPVLGFYPPITQCSPARWGPYTHRRRVLTGDNADCPLCKGTPCRGAVCMERITVERALDALTELYHEPR